MILCRPRLSSTPATLLSLSIPVRRGYTFIELLMVICVLVVLTSVSLPAVLRWQRSMPMDQTISLLQLQIQETRLAAIRSGEVWELTMPENGSPGSRHPLSNEARSESRAISATFAFPVGFHCTDVSASGSNKNTAGHTDSGGRRRMTRLIFFPDGTVSDRMLLLSATGGLQTILKVDRLTGTTSVVPPRNPRNGASVGSSPAERSLPGPQSKSLSRPLSGQKLNCENIPLEFVCGESVC